MFRVVGFRGVGFRVIGSMGRGYGVAEFRVVLVRFWVLKF